MTKTPLAALLLAAAVPLAPAGAAAGDSTTIGGCDYTAAERPGEVTPDHFYGELTMDVVAFSPSRPEPVPVTVTCTLLIDGVAAYELVASGTPVARGATPVEWAGEPFVTWCQTVDYGDATPTESWCVDHTLSQIPPQALADVVTEVLGVAPGSREAVCAAAAEASLTVPEQWHGLMFRDDGDIYYGAIRVFDC